jgi:hypothetical protein
MAKRNYFNKGMLKGTVVRNEIVKYKNAKGVEGSFLALEVNCGGNNKVQASVFNTKSNPTKAQEMSDSFPLGTKVEVSGNVQERDYETESGKKGTSRSVGAMTIRPLTDDSKIGATFLLQGDVLKIVETDNGGLVTIEIDTSYEDANKNKIERKETFVLTADEEVYKKMEEEDVHKGCNAKFKGYIITSVEYDDFGDIVGNISMFTLAELDSVVAKDDIEDAPDLL